MAYAAKETMEKIWGKQFIADLLADDVEAAESVADALEQASGEMDLHLSARFKCPIEGAPLALQMLCANIAVYILANRHTALTTTIEDRYKQAVKMLERIAEGKAGLGADTPGIDIGGEISSSGAAFSAGPRLMGRWLP
ncbi:DUF1320 domain-containing protein [Candidatus Tokpelaia sp.]|uniref:DUF1320 domain-containing protein n=1 Tax=Candidatus Tokpelaia sp. TaxID=2233777 RepID=UPI00123C6A68|nr:DUF1320 domain-containing protein [Candidatus Tokpelaia sp.]KAA6405749.1 DUF1320 domain-containing protein [Candidatus Tokpelaia sp.]